MSGGDVSTLAILLFIVGGYMTPAFVAFVRGHRQSVAITILNVTLGWTLFGWVAALIWSATNERGDRS